MDVGVGVTMIADLMDLGTIVPSWPTMVFVGVIATIPMSGEAGVFSHPMQNIPAIIIVNVKTLLRISIYET